MWRLLKILFILIVLVVGGALAVFFGAPSAMIADMAAKQVREATGRNLFIEGPIKRTLYPNVGFSLGAVRISNAAWAEEPDMIAATSANLAVRMTPLLSGRVEIENLTLVDPVIRLERRVDGTANWDDFSKKKATEINEIKEINEITANDPVANQGTGAATNDLRAILIENAIIANGSLFVRDAIAGQSLAMTAINLTAAMPSLDQAFTVDGSAQVNGQSATLKATVDSLAALAEGAKTRADIALEGVGLEVAFNGTVEGIGQRFPDANGTFLTRLDADKQKTDWVRDAFGDALKEIGGVSLQGAFNASEQALALDVKGAVDIKGRPTNIIATASAADGWTSGAAPASVDVSVRGADIDIGYRGVIAASRTGTPPHIKGDWRARLGDVASALSWIGVKPIKGDPLSRVQTVDLRGSLALNDRRLASDTKGAVGFGGRTVTVNASVTGNADWQTGGPLRTAFAARSKGLFEASWSGSVTPPLANGSGVRAEGDAAFSSNAVKTLVQWAGAGPIPVSDDAFNTAAFTGAISVGDGSFSAKNVMLKVDQAAVRGDVAALVKPGAAPSISANLSASALDLRPITQGRRVQGNGTQGNGIRGNGTRGNGTQASPGSGGASSGAKATGWSPEKLDLRFLKLVNADIKLTTAGLRTHVIRVGKSAMALTLHNGRLQTRILEMALYGGNAQGVAIVNGQGAPSIDIDLNVSGVALKPFLTDTARLDWLEGAGDVALKVNGAGDSMRAIMGSLGGRASMKFSDGAVVGFNLAALVRNLTSLGLNAREAEKTDFAEMAANFSITSGVATTKDFRMIGPLVRLVAEGHIDIGRQSLDLRATPKAVATLKGQGGAADLRGIAFPLTIKGPWSDPSITPDLARGAIESVAGIFTDPEGAGAFLKSLKGGLEENLGETGGAILKEALSSGGDAKSVAADIAKGALREVLGGDNTSDAGGGGKKDPAAAVVESAIDSLLGGRKKGDEKPNAGKLLKGLFGN